MEYDGSRPRECGTRESQGSAEIQMQMEKRDMLALGKILYLGDGGSQACVTQQQ